jgi:shikimate dehydrogenase
MKRAYLFAHPAGHSLSPVMHNAAFRYLSLDGHYEAVDVTSENLANMVQSLRDENVYGANVTIPHKLAVMPMMDKLSKAAKIIGAVNTIVNQNGELVGHNTDAAGFLQGLEDEKVFLRKKVAVMLGAGGAARAIAYALLNSGFTTAQLKKLQNLSKNLLESALPPSLKKTNYLSSSARQKSW